MQQRNNTTAIIIIASLFFIFGFVTWINGALIPFMKTINELTDAQSYLVASASYISFVLMALPASYILNKIGYTFLQQKSINNAIYVFKENVKLFPNNANSWDSLGEAYFTNRDKENAIQCYHKALELDPNSETAKAMLQKLKNIK